MIIHLRQQVNELQDMRIEERATTNAQVSLFFLMRISSLVCVNPDVRVRVHNVCSAPVQLSELQSIVTVTRSQLERSEASRQAIELELDLVRCTLSKTHTEMLEIRRTTDECVHELHRTYPTLHTLYMYLYTLSLTLKNNMK